MFHSQLNYLAPGDKVLSWCAAFAFPLKEYLWPWQGSTLIAAESEVLKDILVHQTHEPHCSFPLHHTFSSRDILIHRYFTCTTNWCHVNCFKKNVRKSFSTSNQCMKLGRQFSNSPFPNSFRLCGSICSGTNCVEQSSSSQWEHWRNTGSARESSHRFL